MARGDLTEDERAAIYAAAWITAAADGILGSREKRLLRQIRQELSIPPSRARQVEGLGFKRKLKLEVPANPDARQQMFDVVIRISASDRGLAERERSIALSIGRQLGLPDSCVDDALPNRALEGASSAAPIRSKGEVPRPGEGLAAKLVALLAQRGRRPWYLQSDVLDAIAQGLIAFTFLAVWVAPGWFGSSTIRGLPVTLFVEAVCSILVVWIGAWAATTSSIGPSLTSWGALAMVTLAIVLISIVMKSFLPMILFLPSIWSGYFAGRKRRAPDLGTFVRVWVTLVVAMACLFLPLPALGFRDRPVKEGSGEWRDTATGENVTYRYLAGGAFFFGIRSGISTFRIFKGRDGCDDENQA